MRLFRRIRAALRGKKEPVCSSSDATEIVALDPSIWDVAARIYAALATQEWFDVAKEPEHAERMSRRAFVLADFFIAEKLRRMGRTR